MSSNKQQEKDEGQRRQSTDDTQQKDEGEKRETGRKESKPKPSKKDQDKKGKKDRSKSAPPGRHNKIYRCPPTPPPEETLEKEKGFVLDCRAVSSISVDYSKTNPKLGPVAPPYNSQKDNHVGNYYSYSGVDRTLKKTGQFGKTATSIEGPAMDSFHSKGAGYQYVFLRNSAGAGHSRELVDGHAQFMKGLKEVTGYNGKYGFRRNTPWLRQVPTPFEPLDTGDVRSPRY